MMRSQRYWKGRFVRVVIFCTKPNQCSHEVTTSRKRLSKSYLTFKK